MKVKLQMLLLCLILFFSLQAKDNFLYQYKITFKQNPSTNLAEAKELIKRFTHTDDITVIEGGKSIQLKTIYKINNNILIGKFEKLNFPIEKIILENQNPISDELRDKIDKIEKDKHAEIIKSGK
jgi:transcription elongation factor